MLEWKPTEKFLLITCYLLPFTNYYLLITDYQDSPFVNICCEMASSEIGDVKEFEDWFYFIGCDKHLVVHLNCFGDQGGAPLIGRAPIPPASLILGASRLQVGSILCVYGTQYCTLTGRR